MVLMLGLTNIEPGSSGKVWVTRGSITGSIGLRCASLRSRGAGGDEYQTDEHIPHGEMDLETLF
jgi:hypothetical protein